MTGVRTDRPRGLRLATRFALACAATVAVLVLLAGLAVLRFARADVRADLDAELRAQAVRLRPVAVRLLARGTPSNVDSSQALPPPQDGCVAVRGSGSWVVAGDCPSPDQLDRLPPRRVGAMTVLVGTQRRRAVAVNLATAGGRLWVIAAPGQPQRQLDRLRLRVGLVTLLAVPVAGFAGVLVGRAATRPLRRLQQRLADLPRVRRVGGGSGVPEIDEVAEVVDRTLDRYDEQVARTDQALRAARSFAATAAHELRTPLAGIGTNLDVLRTHEHLDPAERADVIADLIAEHRRAVGLLGMLRTLAQGELTTTAQFERVELTDLVDDAVDAAGRRHPDARITLRGPESVPYHGWPEGLACIVDNLLDNAAVHGRDPQTGRATIVVSVDQADQYTTIEVTDDGPGVAPQRRERIFERFDKSPESPGSGLGLALVAQQVALHGGTIEVGPPPGGRFTVRLPAVSANTVTGR